ncbi:MAG: anti-sigma factor [Pseudanabaena sp. SU_2_4]|nr:anti-sigma factor [Pseudanabaena sp. SU_2_4]NKB17442.1 anti-sigma factor [Pseudanabaena sp. CRU_2_10]
MLPEEFSELMALAALEAVDDEAILLADTYASTSVELEQELAEMRRAVGAIPYGDTSLPISRNLKDRLFKRIATEEEQASQPSAEIMPFQAIRFSEMEWQPHPVAGVTIAVLHTDPVTRRLSALVRCQPGVHYPVHRHAGIEEILMLEGNFVCDGNTYGVGDYLLSGSGSAHDPESPDGCLFFVRTSMDDQYEN